MLTPLYTKKTCPICFQQFDAHPSAIYCTITCANRAAYRRRSERRFRKATAPTSPYQFIYEHLDSDMLSRIYLDIQTHAYERDIRINGQLPSDVPVPSDVILENLGDHYVAYHKSRQLML